MTAGPMTQWLADNYITDLIGDRWSIEGPVVLAFARVLDGERADLERTNAELLAALEIALHSLVTLGGLSATDGFKAYGYALDGGCDPSGAWDVFLEQTFKIDESAAINTIEAAIAKARGQAVAP